MKTIEERREEAIDYGRASVVTKGEEPKGEREDGVIFYYLDSAGISAD